MRLRNKIFIITIFFVIASCSNRKGCDKDSNIEESITIVSEEDSSVIKNDVDIETFKRQCDSLLKEWKNEKYYFELKSDTLNYSTDDKEKFRYGHGIFWVLYNENTIDLLIRHYIYAPNTKRMFRIYLAEVFFRNKDDLNERLSKLELYWYAPNFDYSSAKARLSPFHDYITTNENKLLWLNASYEYSKDDFLKLIEILKHNIDKNYIGQMLCLWGSDCTTENVP